MFRWNTLAVIRGLMRDFISVPREDQYLFQPFISVPKGSTLYKNVYHTYDGFKPAYIADTITLASSVHTSTWSATKDPFVGDNTYITLPVDMGRPWDPVYHAIQYETVCDPSSVVFHYDIVRHLLTHSDVREKLEASLAYYKQTIESYDQRLSETQPVVVIAKNGSISAKTACHEIWEVPSRKAKSIDITWYGNPRKVWLKR